ncbi:MAG: beta-N-acetylhexosaminidase [Gammaproteobacteria bacterium]|nr:MAG: beta-N-acetylhexosaminidase [Gammaproteobacteria bacterium]
MISDSALFMFGIQGKSLLPQEIQWLKHPLTAGVILFTRNYEHPAQIRALVKTLRATAAHELLIAVDHEGGRVQRFRQGFTSIPPMAELGLAYDQNPENGLQLAQAMGYVMAYEIGDCDIDFSFAPVLDVQTDFSTIIGDRAFHTDVKHIAPLASAFYAGMRQAGTAGVGKHFPGHGNVVADSHIQLPVSHATLDHLQQTDLPPFVELIREGIEAIMPAHILYKAVDNLPAGFSRVWLVDILRKQLGFDGCIISDDLDMAGAAAYGDMPARVKLAEKYCDLILLCNNHEHMQLAYASQTARPNQPRQARLQALKRNPQAHNSESYQSALATVRTFNATLFASGAEKSV